MSDTLLVYAATYYVHVHIVEEAWRCDIILEVPKGEVATLIVSSSNELTEVVSSDIKYFSGADGPRPFDEQGVDIPD